MPLLELAGTQDPKMAFTALLSMCVVQNGCGAVEINIIDVIRMFPGIPQGFAHGANHGGAGRIGRRIMVSIAAGADAEQFDRTGFLA